MNYCEIIESRKINKIRKGQWKHKLKIWKFLFSLSQLSYVTPDYSTVLTTVTELNLKLILQYEITEYSNNAMYTCICVYV